MIKSSPTTKTLFITLVVLTLAAFGLWSNAVASTPGTEGPMPGPKVVVRAGYSDSPPPRVPPPSGFSLQGVQNATITVNYIGNWDAPAQNAFQYAVDIWESQINSPVEIVVDARWEPLGADVLGAARATTVYRDFPNAPATSTWYPVALANALAETDLNGGAAEIEANFNRNFASWYFNTDGLTPFDRWDFSSVVLHELGHGLGFFGSMDVSGALGSWGFLDSPFVYDLFAENGAGQNLINNFPNNSPALAAQLQSDDLFFNGPSANAANGGNRPELYAPNPWETGSSYSHLGDVFDGTPSALMTSDIFNGEAIHDPGPVTRGIFQDMGWTLASESSPEPPDLSLTVQLVGGSNFFPGDPVTFVLDVENQGAGVATTVVLTDLLSSDILTPTWTASASLAGTTARPGPPFVWDLPDMDPGASGSVTVQGTLDPALTPGFTIVNQATVGTADPDSDEGNNTSTVVVGGARVYLPIVFGGND